MIQNRRIPTAGVVIFLFLAYGCASSGTRMSDKSPIIPDSESSFTQGSQSADVPGFNPHSIVGSGFILGDSETGSLEIVPSRAPSIHLNIRQFLEDAAPCSDCFTLKSITHNPDDTWDLDLEIRHPFPGYDNLTAFDMRLIMMFQATEIWFASDILTQDPDGIGGYVPDPDGYTTIFNPVQFPVGSDYPFFTYTDGFYSSSFMPDSTLNPYMDYYSYGNRNVMGAGESATRTWTIKFPTGTFILGYAIDCCWDAPLVDPPVKIPDDFPLSANKPEAYWVAPYQTTTLANLQGATATVNVTAWDWQGDLGEAWIECPDLWTGKISQHTIAENPPATYYIFVISNETGQQAGLYRALVGVKDALESSYPWDFTTYQFMDIEVKQIFDPCCTTEPVAAFKLPGHLITGQEISLTSESYDPDSDNCELTINWDLNGDGAYDDATGDFANVSFPYVGFWQVGIQVIDQCDLVTTLVLGTEVHAGITMDEDADSKTLDTRYNLVGAELTPSEASSAVDLNDPDGPWDFTELPLTDIGNYLACISPDNPDVEDFAADITGSYFYFLKGSGQYNGITGNTWLAQRYDIDPDRLVWVGMYQDTYLGSFNFLPPMNMEYPFWIFSEGTYSIGIAPYNLSIDWEGWGEGRVTVPYEGISNAECVVLRYMSTVGSPDINGGCLIYQWILDDGTSVAYAVAANYDEIGIQNVDMDTWTVTGVAHFAALESIEPY